MPTPSERLKELDLQLPAVAKPVAAYVPAVRHGDTIHISGQIPVRDGEMVFKGKAGLVQSLPDAQQAARLCTLNAIAAASEVAGGVDQLARVLKVWVYVASADGFTDQHLVANGASELLKDIFGDNGAHARAAVGMAELPLDATVEIDVLFATA